MVHRDIIMKNDLKINNCRWKPKTKRQTNYVFPPKQRFPYTSMFLNTIR